MARDPARGRDGDPAVGRAAAAVGAVGLWSTLLAAVPQLHDRWGTKGEVAAMWSAGAKPFEGPCPYHAVARPASSTGAGSYATLSAMGLLLMACGLALAVVGTWSGYRNAREAMLPFVRQGDPTRATIDAARPLHAREGVRRAARSVVAAVAWLVLALYGLFLASTGSVVGGLS